jgi:hypothetical protein
MNFEQIIEKMGAVAEKFKELQPPTQIEPGSVEADVECRKLMECISKCTNMALVAKKEQLEIQNRINKQYFEQMELITNEELKAKGIGLNQKGTYINTMLADEQLKADKMKAYHDYFINSRSDYIEWSQMYKKLRSLPE